MSHSTALQAGSDSALPSPSEGPPLPCERCGTFIQGAPQLIGERQLCESCAPLLRKELRLYPTWYVYTWGILINCTIAGVLAAINWKRLGDKARMRNALIVAAVGFVWSTFVVIMDFQARSMLSIVHVVATAVAAQALDQAYKSHKRQGGARANLLWPVGVVLGILVPVALAYSGYLLLTDQLPEE